MAALLGGVGSLFFGSRGSAHVQRLSDGDPELRKLELLAGKTTDSCKSFDGPCDPEKQGLICLGFEGPCRKEVVCKKHTPEPCMGNWYSPSCPDHDQCPHYQNPS